MTTGPLSPSTLLTLLPAVLPPGTILSSPQDALAALVHTALASLSFRLANPSTEEGASNTRLPGDWNAHGPEYYSFRYRHEQSSLEFIVKVSKLGQRTVVNAIAVETDKTATLDVPTADFTSAASYPLSLPETASNPTNADTTSLANAYISAARITDFTTQLKLKIVQSLIPGLRKDGYIEESSTSAQLTRSGQNPASTSAERRDPPPARPQPRPDDPFAHPRAGPYSHIAPQNPLEIGRRDLEPFGGFGGPPPLFPGGSGPLFPGGGIGGGGDGMFVGPDHPIFGNRGRGGQGVPPGPWGGDGYLPPMGAPPGARFDPVGPGIGPVPGPNGGPGRRAGGEPDNDEFMPPGARDMFM